MLHHARRHRIATASQILSFVRLQDHHPHRNLATTIGFNHMAVVAGGALFQPLVGYFLTLRASTHTTFHYTTQDYLFTLSVIPTCFFIGMLLATFLIKEAHELPNHHK